MLFNELLESDFLPLILVITALLIERVLPWPEKYHPLTLFRLIAANLAKKVNPSKPRSSAQRRISGSLSIIILLLPMLAILIFYEFIAQFPIFLELLMLVIALQFQKVVRQFKWTQRSIKQDKKVLARQHLSQIVLRDTNNLSPIGLGKAGIESILSRFFYQQFAVILWFVAFGGLAALTIRLLFELSQSWNTKLSHNQDYGLPVATLCKLAYAIPGIIYGFLFALGYGFVGAIRAMAKRPKNLLTHYYLTIICACSIGMSLGGPEMDQGGKKRFSKVGSFRENKFDKKNRASTRMYHTQSIFSQSISIFI